MDDITIKEAVGRYNREFDRFKKLSEIVYQICLDLVQSKLTIRATVQRRTKTLKSFQDKLIKNQVYKTVDDVFENISDLAGVRIITYMVSDREKIVEEIAKVFKGKGPERKPKVERKDRIEIGRHYRATHCLVCLPDEYLDDANSNLRNTVCEIQVCTLLAHVFNEIEHDLLYKPLNGKISSEEHELLDQLGLITKSGDLTIKRLLEATDERLKHVKGEFGDVHEFVIRMREELKLGLTFSNNAGQLYHEFVSLDMITPQSIIKELTKPDESLIDVGKAEYARLKNFLFTKNRDPILEDNSSDVLLAALLRKKVDDVLLNHKNGKCKGRPNRLVQIARIYKEMTTIESRAGYEFSKVNSSGATLSLINKSKH